MRLTKVWPRSTILPGAIAVGARPFLIAFNVILRSTDIAIARQIARTIRARNGGLPFVKALGFRLQSRDLVQVSMNLINYEVTGMTAAYDAVQRQADLFRCGDRQRRDRWPGPAKRPRSQRCLLPKLENFSEAKILEHQIDQCSSV